MTMETVSSREKATDIHGRISVKRQSAFFVGEGRFQLKHLRYKQDRIMKQDGVTLMT